MSAFCKEKDTKHKVKRQQEWTLLLRTSLKEFNKTVTLRGGRETEFSFGFFFFINDITCRGLISHAGGERGLQNTMKQ